MLPQTADVIIIGGGVMGASTAYHLALRGIKNILLLEKDEYFGLGATGRCAGGIRYQFATEINIRLSLESLPMLERFEAETGQGIDLRHCGYLFLLTNINDVNIFKNNLRLQNMLGVSTQWLDGETIRSMLPLFQLEDVLAGTFNAQDGLADPNSVVMGYINASRRLGVTALTGFPVTGIKVRNNKVDSVQTSNGEVSSPIVIDATGPWAGVTSRLAGVDVPITPIRRQILTTAPIPELPPDFPFVIDFAQSLYFHREGLGLLTGMSNPNEKPGFDQSVDQEWEYHHLESATGRLPLLDKAQLLSHWAGLYEVSPDAHPIFGKTPVEGYFIITGFSGHGFMHGPVSGKIMSEIILDGKSQTVDVSMLDLARFEEGRQIKEYNVV